MSSVRFLLNLCKMDKDHDGGCTEFFSSLVDSRLFPALILGAQTCDALTPLIATLSVELVGEITKVVPGKVRVFFAGKPELMRSLIDVLCGPRPDGTKGSVAMLIQTLMEPDKNPESESFYDSLFSALIETVKLIPPKSQFKHYALEILSGLVPCHPLRVRQAVIQGSVLLSSLCEALKSPVRHIQLGAVQFVKAVVEKSKDDILIAFLARSQVVDDLVTVLKSLRGDCLILGTIRGLLKTVVTQNEAGWIEALTSKADCVDAKLVPELGKIREKHATRKTSWDKLAVAPETPAAISPKKLPALLGETIGAEDGQGGGGRKRLVSEATTETDSDWKDVAWGIRLEQIKKRRVVDDDPDGDKPELVLKSDTKTS